MFQLATDTIHNKLVITLHRSMSHPDFYDVDVQLRKIIPRLSPNFTIINNISRYQGSDDFPTNVFHESLQFLKEYQVGQVIRVVGGSRVALLAFAQNTRSIENYSVVHVPTLHDALKIVPRLRMYAQ